MFRFIRCSRSWIVRKPASRVGARFVGFMSSAALASLIASTGPALALDQVTFGLNWLADPEAGGYYQALVDGTYAKYGLDVTIQPGGPELNGGLLLLAGKLDFVQGGDLLGNFLAAQQNIPIVAVAADFQIDPQILMSHPGVGLDKWTDLPKAPIAYISAGGIYSFYTWMVKAWGFKLSVVKPYDFDSAPFIMDKHSIQEGYVTAEPYSVEQQGHFKPNVFLLVKAGIVKSDTDYRKVYTLQFVDKGVGVALGPGNREGAPGAGTEAQPRASNEPHG